MSVRVRITDERRRARLVARHDLARTASEVTEAVRGVVALHSSDPLTPYLAAWARVPDVTTHDLDRALYEARTLWRLHAMRRTLFVVPTGEAGVFDAAAGRDIAARERRRLEGWLSAEMDAARVPAWLADVEARVLEVLADGREWRTQELAAVVPELGTQITLGTGRWTTRAPLSSRLLFVLGMEGRIARASPVGSWRSSQYRWVATDRWFGRPLETIDAAAGRARLARRYLTSHGPVTLTDLRWWTGWTARQSVAALRDAGAVAVDLDSGGEGFVLPDDVDPAGHGARAHVTLLPALDPTPMGWKERDWYLPGAHVARLFDRNGNAGPTVWVDGRVVGGWAQRPDGQVVYRMLEDVGTAARERLAVEAEALAHWLGGRPVTPRFRTPLERELSA